MKWHRIKTEADLPPIDQRVLLHKYNKELRFEWVDIGCFIGLTRNDNGGYSYVWETDFDSAHEGDCIETENLNMYDHWAEIETPPIAVLDGMSKEEYVAHTAEMGGVAEVAEMEAHG